MIELQRKYRTAHSIFGSMSIGQHSWKTLENKEKAIPAGIYRVVITRSERFSKKSSEKAGKPINTYLPELLDVPNRKGIRIHIANMPNELEGCIAPGRTAFREGTDPDDIVYFMAINSYDHVESSTVAFNEFMLELKKALTAGTVLLQIND